MVTRHSRERKLFHDVSEFSGDFTWDESFCEIPRQICPVSLQFPTQERGNCERQFLNSGQLQDDICKA